MTARTVFPRTAATAAVGFAILFFVGVFFLPDLPEQGDSDASVEEVYTDAVSRTRIVVASFLVAASAPLFLWFLANLHALLKATATPAALATVALASGVIYVALTLASTSALHFLAVGVAVGELPGIDAGLARAFTQLGFQMLLVPALFAALPLVLATSVVAVQGGLPRWWAWVGFPVAILLLLGVAYMPMLAVPLWAAVLGIHLLVRPGAGREVAG